MASQPKVPRLHVTPKFVAVRRAVIRGQETIAQAKSHTFARRIANALNQYTPSPKGY